MFVPTDQGIATLMTIVGLLGWGLWGNLLVLSSKLKRPPSFATFYVTFTFALFVLSIFWGAVLGEIEIQGDPRQWSVFDFNTTNPDYGKSVGFAIAGGAIWNAGNILLCSGISMLGLALAFPLGVGTALWVGTASTYGVQGGGGNAGLLFAGVAIAFVAVVVCAQTHRLKEKDMAAKAAAEAEATTTTTTTTIEDGGKPIPADLESEETGDVEIGKAETSTSADAQEYKPSFWRSVLVCVFAGIGLAFGGMLPTFAMASTEGGALSPYGIMFWYTLACVISNFIIVPLSMLYPIDGSPRASATPLRNFVGEYFRTSALAQLVCFGAGAIWMVGFLGNQTASQSDASSPAVAYAIGQCAPVAGILSGLILWNEFAAARLWTWLLLGLTVLLYIGAIICITFAQN